MGNRKLLPQADVAAAAKQQHTIVFLPIDAHGHVNAMIGLADQFKARGKYRTVFLCNDSQSAKHFGHELVLLRQLKQEEEEEQQVSFKESDQPHPMETISEESIFMGDARFNAKWAAMVDLLDLRVSKPEFVVQSLAHNYHLLKLTLETEVLPMDSTIERCLLELKPDLVLVDQLCPIPAVRRLAQSEYASKCGLKKPLLWMSLATCNPMPLYHAHHQEHFPPPLMGLSAVSAGSSGGAKLSGCELEVEQLRYERAVRESGLPATLLEMAKLACLMPAAATAADSCAAHNAAAAAEEAARREFVRNESPWLNLYMFPRELDYAREGRGQLPANRWVRVDSLIRASSVVGESTTSTDRWLQDEALLKQVADWRLQSPVSCVIYLSMGTTMSSNLSLMSALLRQVTCCLEFEPRWRFLVAMGPRASQLPVQLRNRLDYWQAKGRLLTSGWWPQPELLRRHLIDVCVTHGGNNTLCELFAFKPVPHLLLIAGFHDQLDNARRVQDLGWGVSLSAGHLLEQEEQLLVAQDAVPLPAAMAIASGGDLLRSSLQRCMELSSNNNTHNFEGSKQHKHQQPQQNDADKANKAELRDSQFCAHLIELRLQRELCVEM